MSLWSFFNYQCNNIHWSVSIIKGIINIIINRIITPHPTESKFFTPGYPIDLVFYSGGPYCLRKKLSTDFTNFTKNVFVWTSWKSLTVFISLPLKNQPSLKVIDLKSPPPNNLSGSLKSLIVIKSTHPTKSALIKVIKTPFQQS